MITRRIVVLAVLLAGTLAAADVGPEVLVGTSATLITDGTKANTARQAIALQNLGPNPIYCAKTAAGAVVGKAWKVNANGAFVSFPLNKDQPLYCITTVAQLTGAGTVILEVNQPPSVTGNNNGSDTSGTIYVSPSANTSGVTTETLVSTTATAMPCTAGRKSQEIQNLGPNPIYCAFSSGTAVATKARRVDANGGVWSLDATSAVCVWCVTVTAVQSTGAATISSEVQ
jgi:hypothetical protein